MIYLAIEHGIHRILLSEQREENYNIIYIVRTTNALFSENNLLSQLFTVGHTGTHYGALTHDYILYKTN